MATARREAMGCAGFAALRVSGSASRRRNPHPACSPAACTSPIVPRMRERMTFLVAVFAALAVGCDGSLASPDGSQASPASSPASPDWSPLCPATAPAIGSSCTDATLSLGASDQLMCEYG